MVSPKTLGIDLSSHRFLLIDDNTVIRNTLRRVLRGFGVKQIKEATDGIAAFQLMKTWQPTFIFTDWRMAPMGGSAFLRQLRHKDAYPLSTIPTIVLTGHANTDVIKEADANGANQVLSKPVVPGKTLERIAWVLNDKRRFFLHGDYYVLRDPDAAQPPVVLDETASTDDDEDVWELD